MACAPLYLVEQRAFDYIPSELHVLILQDVAQPIKCFEQKIQLFRAVVTGSDEL
jgi:hypothetical protein